MRFDFCLYDLYPLQALNAHVSKKTRTGALLKFLFEDETCGYADCHPWIELGDKALLQQFTYLAKNQPTELTSCSLQFAKLDAIARLQHQPLLTSQTKLQSHYLITDVLTWTNHQTTQILNEGFTHIKIKMGRNWQEECKKNLQLFAEKPLKLRLDFNEILTFTETLECLNVLKPLQTQIDYIEDPCLFDKNKWQILQQLGWTLACDRQLSQALHLDSSAKVLIVKPAIYPFYQQLMTHTQRVVVTSYLDHPFGQVTAAYVASILDPFNQEVHGLLSHHAYQSHEMSLQLPQQGPFFSPAKGVGFGFDHLLQKLQWKSWK